VPVLVALATGVGLINPQVGSLARSRWLEAGARRGDGDTFVPAAMGYEGAADEASFVLGPVLVGVLALAGPPAALLAALVIAVVAQTGFALHGSAVGRRLRTSGPRTAIPVAGVLPLAAVLACVGLVFGASQTGVTAKLDLVGHARLTGVVYAAMGLGSAVAALLAARLLHRVALRTRIIGSGVGLALTTTVLLLASGPVALALACLLVGLTVAPVLVSAYALVGRIVPPGRSATVMAVLSTAGTVGVAVGAAASGVLIDQVGVRPAQLIPVAAGLLAATAALTIRRSEPGHCTRTPRGSRPSGASRGDR
jgi:MFS family permease